MLFALSFGVLSTVPTLPATDRAPAALRARAERPAETGALPAYLGSVGAGNSLFHLVGGDNAECVRSVPDVTGDGRDEVLVGIGESGTDNVFCLDGASSGAATVVWSLETDGGASGGSCYGDQSIVPASDSETSGHANVLLGTAWGGRTAYDLDTLAGGEVWRFDTYLEPDSGWVYSLCEVSDVTGDGVPEVAFGSGSDDDAVYLVDGASSGGQATVLWKYAAGDAVYSVRNLGDVNGDGTDDVLAAIGDDVDVLVCLEGDSSLPGGHVLWTYTPGATVFACGVLSDVTGDGIDEALAVLWTGAGSAIRCRDGRTGTAVWSSTAVSSFGTMVDELADVTGDGKNDVVVGSWENAAIVLDGDDGSLVWKTTVGTTNGGDVWTARAIEDLDGDGHQDVVAGSFDTHVWAFDGVTGTPFWAFATGNRVFSVYPVGDLNGDGRPEVAAGMQDTTSSTVVHVLEGDADIDGSLGTRYCSPNLPNSTGSSGVMTVTGSALHADDDLTLSATQLPTGSNIGYFLMGQGMNSFVPPGSGSMLCVAPGLLRFLPPVQNTNELPGGFSRGVGTNGPVSGAITPGSTWNFQAWHRDFAAGTSHFTDAVSVTFQ